MKTNIELYIEQREQSFEVDSSSDFYKTFLKQYSSSNSVDLKSKCLKELKKCVDKCSDDSFELLDNMRKYKTKLEQLKINSQHFEFDKNPDINICIENDDINPKLLYYLTYVTKYFNTKNDVIKKWDEYIIQRNIHKKFKDDLENFRFEENNRNIRKRKIEKWKIIKKLENITLSHCVNCNIWDRPYDKSCNLCITILPLLEDAKRKKIKKTEIPRKFRIEYDDLE